MAAIVARRRHRRRVIACGVWASLIVATAWHRESVSFPVRILAAVLDVNPVTAATAHAQPAGNAPSSTLLDRLADRLDQSLISRCLTPETSKAMNGVVASGVLRSILGSDYSLESGSIGGNEIRLQLKEKAGKTYDVVLAAPGARAGNPDGRGQRFLFYVESQTVPDARTKETLLTVAGAFDAAIPDSAFAPCAGGAEAKGDRRYPRRIALGSAIAEASVIVATILYGITAIRRL